MSLTSNFLIIKSYISFLNIRSCNISDIDIDICVKLQDPDYFTRMEIKESLEERFNAKVDVVSLTAIMRSLFRNHIEKDAIYI